MFDRWSSPVGTNSAKKRKSSYLDYENSSEHVELTERLCKSLYYGYNTPPDYPSLPLSEIAVKFFQDAAPRSLGKVDMYLASSMTKHATMSPCSVMLGIIYVNRLKDKNPEYLMQISSADLFLISMMMASKYLYDEGVYEEVFNEDWAVVGMMETAELNQLEHDFLTALDWRLMVHDHEFKQYLDTIEKKIAFHESCKRGWLTYTDVWTLTQGSFYGDICRHMGQEIAKMFAVSTVAYIAGVLTLLTSSCLAVAMTSKLTALTQQPSFMPELPFHLPDLSFDTVSPVNLLGVSRNVGYNLPTMNLPPSGSSAWLLPSSVSSISSFLYQMMVVSSLEYVSYNLPGDLNLLWGQGPGEDSDKEDGPTPASDALWENQQKLYQGVFISSRNEKLSSRRYWIASMTKYREDPNPDLAVADNFENSFDTAESNSPRAMLETSAGSHDWNSDHPKNQPSAWQSQVSNSSSQKDLPIDELFPRSKYPAISTALLNLVTLLSLKTSPSSGQESSKEGSHCKHCKRAHCSSDRTKTPEAKLQAADPLLNCSRVSAFSKSNLLTKCSWSQWRSERKSNCKQNQLSRGDVYHSRPVLSRPATTLTPFSSSLFTSPVRPSYLYPPDVTPPPALVPSDPNKNQTGHSLPQLNDHDSDQAGNGCYQLEGCYRYDPGSGDLFNQIPDRAQLQNLTATFLMGSVKKKSVIRQFYRDSRTPKFAGRCAGAASSRLHLSNPANMAACVC